MGVLAVALACAVQGQHGQAGLCGNQHPHVIGDREALAANQRLLGHKDLHKALQPPLQGRWQVVVQRELPLQQPAPCGRERLLAHALALASCPPGPAQQCQQHSQANQGKGKFRVQVGARYGMYADQLTLNWPPMCSFQPRPVRVKQRLVCAGAPRPVARRFGPRCMACLASPHLRRLSCLASLRPASSSWPQPLASRRAAMASSRAWVVAPSASA